jgi:serine/threonine protein kinase
VSSRLSALHALPLAHRDLKPSNLLPAALIDFGQSLPLAEVEGKQNPAVGTTTYKAPEQLMLPARGEK